MIKLKSSLALTLLLPLAAAGQGDLYIPAGTTVYYFGNVAIYGNVVNNGNLGTFGGDTVTFLGQNWTNGSTATFPVVGAGGLFRFNQPSPAATQTLNGGYASGAQPSFPRLLLNNPSNVSLAGKTRVKEDLSFAAGKLVLNANDLVMGSPSGNGGAGTISNYTQSKFVVTNNNNGHLVKESYTGTYIFPVGKGTADGTDYAPARVDNGTANGIHVNVRDYASTAAAAPRPTNTGIDRMWNIYGNNPGGSSFVDLQHDQSSNQAGFQPNVHYVTRYVGTAPNTAGDMTSFDAWERNTPGPGITPGTLTTGAPIATASERNRTYTSLATSGAENNAYYTKASGPLCLNLRAYVEGALLNNGGATATDGRPLMRDNLRVNPFDNKNYIPVRDPYEFATQFTNVTAKYTKYAPQDASHPEYQQVTDSATVFGVSGQNAIVDWVFVELRDKTTNTTIAATRAALLQRDGDIVDVDGQSCLSFPGITIDSYYVAVRHRSHLGTMTKYAQSSDNMQTLVDFTVPTTPLYDNGVVSGFNFTGLSQKSNVVGTYRAMWFGDWSADGKVKYDNPNDDQSVLLTEVRRYPGNTTRATNYDFAYGYFQGDYDMNGKAKFDNPNDDLSFLKLQVQRYPLNTTRATNFDFFLQQLP